MLSAALLCCVHRPTETAAVLENDVLIIPFEKAVDSNYRFTFRDSSAAIRLSKDFWRYLLRTHPQLSAQLFLGHLLPDATAYPGLNDSTRAIYHLDEWHVVLLARLLADSAGGSERGSGPAFFVVPNDTSGSAAHLDTMNREPRNYMITAAVRADFARFRGLLADTAGHYLFLYKRSFADSLLRPLVAVE